MRNRIAGRTVLTFMLLSASVLAEDLTVNGTTYENVRWGQVTPTTVEVFHRAGISTLPLANLPTELQKRFGYDPQRAAAYVEGEAKRRAADAQARAAAAATALKDIQSACIAYYPFNGNASDESGNGHDGDVAGGTLCKDRFGRQRSAYQFNGTKSRYYPDGSPIGYIKTGIRDNIEAFSVWFAGFDYVTDPHDRPQSDTHGLGGFGGIVSQCSTDENGFQFRRCGPRGFAEIKIANKDWDLEQILFDSRWHHAVFSKNGSKTEVYCDGKLVANIPSTWSTAGELKIGQCIDRTHRGLVDDVRVFNRPLTAREVEVLFRVNPNVSTPSSAQAKEVTTSSTQEATPIVTGNNSSLKIVTARYGAKDSWADVTSKVQSMVKNNSLKVQAGAQLAGKDPIFGVVKELQITYQLGSEQKTVSVREGSSITIP